MDYEKIKKLQHFFEVDMKIKKEIYMIAPVSILYFDEYSMNKYTDNLYNLLTYTFSEFKCIAIDIFGKNSNVLDRILYLEQKIIKEFYSCGYDINRLKNFYKKNVSDMGVDFINCVKGECVGYTGSGTSSVNMANSINEMLHFLHSYIVNNDDILQSIPVLNEKINEDDYPIRLRGINSQLFEQLFINFPLNLDVGWTDMVAVSDNKIILMVRDRGHALTIEISVDNDKTRMEYFIPKLCNIEMINSLPGINKVNNESVGATGAIEFPTNSLNQILYEFISMVPTDIDMVYNKNKLS